MRKNFAEKRLNIKCPFLLDHYSQEQQDLNEGGAPRKELEAEIRRLKKENKRLEMEREILKKAAAFFAKESS